MCWGWTGVAVVDGLRRFEAEEWLCSRVERAEPIHGVG